MYMMSRKLLGKRRVYISRLIAIVYVPCTADCYCIHLSCT